MRTSGLFPDVGGAFVLFFAILPSTFDVFPAVHAGCAREREERRRKPEDEEEENIEALFRALFSRATKRHEAALISLRCTEAGR
jgi:hypothetical protein